MGIANFSAGGGMGWAAAWVAGHGYIAVGVILFLSSLGLPMPVVVTMLLAGAAAHAGKLSIVHLFLLGVLVENIGATLMYLAGRATGWWLLGRLCRLTMDPEVCIFRSADFFYEKGARTLLIARFVPGLNSMAPPLAGSLHMRPFRFWRMDVVGAMLHCAAWMGLGFLLSPFLLKITNALAVVGHVVLGVVALAALGYAAAWVVVAIKGRKYSQVARVTAEEVLERLENPTLDRPVVIADVRSHGYYDPGMQRIKNSIRVEPSRLLPELEALRETLAPECEIYVYCSCLRDATSARIAHMLNERGNNVRVIQGGLKAWTKAGFPMELVPPDDMRHLPRFD